MRRTVLKRKTPLERHSRVRPRNAKRLANRRAVQFGAQAELCRTLPCMACGAPPPSDPHHVKSRGASGRDAHCVALCRACHEAVHARGLEDFKRRTGIDLHAKASQLHARLEKDDG